MYDSFKVDYRVGTPWQSISWDSVVSLPWSEVLSLVRELSSCKPCCGAKKKKKKMLITGEWRKVRVHFFPQLYPVVPAPFVERIFRSLLNCLDMWQKSTDCMGLLLTFLPCPADLYIHPPQSKLSWLLQLYIVLKSSGVCPRTLFFFLKIALAALSSLHSISILESGCHFL